MKPQTKSIPFTFQENTIFIKSLFYEVQKKIIIWSDVFEWYFDFKTLI